MVKFQDMVGNFMLASIILLAFFSSMILLQSENNAPQPLVDNPVFNESFRVLTENIDSTTAEAEEKYDVFNTEEPKPGFGSIVLFGIVSVGKTFSNIIFGMFAAVIKLPLVIFGIPAQVYNLILTWLIILVIVTVWLLYKLGG